jgi:hypothetical protein
LQRDESSDKQVKGGNGTFEVNEPCTHWHHVLSALPQPLLLRTDDTKDNEFCRAVSNQNAAPGSQQKYTAFFENDSAAIVPKNWFLAYHHNVSVVPWWLRGKV